MNICPTNKLSKSIESLTIEDGDMNNNDRTKHISLNEGVSEDEHASDTEKNEDLTTGEGNLEEVLRRPPPPNSVIILIMKPKALRKKRT